MGVLDLLRLGANPRRPDYLSSPFTDAQLTQVVWNDVFGVPAAILTRADAMAIPAVAKARSLICTTVARLPLVVMNKDGQLPDDLQPSWTYRTDGAISPFLRMLFTLDDLLFFGASLWQVVRGSDRQILTADRVPFEWWKTEVRGDSLAILIHDEPVSADEVIFIPGPVDGLLDRASTSLRAARDIEATVANRVKSPLPLVELHATGDTELTETEARDLITGYIKARQDPMGTVVYTPSSVQLISHGDRTDMGFATDGRNAARLDVANHVGLPASLLEGSVSEASLTYSTQEGKRNELVDYGLAQWIEAIQSRLSQDDVVPRGQRVRFDMADFLALAPSPTGPTSQD